MSWFVRTVVVSVLALASGSFSASVPDVHTRPHHQSPVRAEPDDLLLIPGYGFLSGAEVVYQRLADTTQSPNAPGSIPARPNEDVGFAPVIGVELEAVVAHLPAVMLAGEPYALWVRNPGEPWSEAIRINDARPLWFSPPIGHATESVATLPRRLKVIGRNLEPAPGHVTRVRLSGPANYEIVAADDADPATAIEHYVASIALPSSMPVGSYAVEVSRDETSWIAVPDLTFDVLADPATLPTFDPSDPVHGGCGPGDGADDAICIQHAIDAARDAGGGEVVFGPGDWELKVVPDPLLGRGLSHGILVHPGVSLIGQGVSTTRIVRTDAWGTVAGVCDDEPCVGAVFTLQGGNNVRGIHFQDTFPDKDFRTVYLQLGKRPWWLQAGDPTVIEDVTIAGNRFTDMHIAIADGNLPLRRVFVVGNELQAYKDDLLYGGNSGLKDLLFQVEDSIVANNVFYPGDYFAPDIDQGVIASQIGAALRLDFSHNVAEGRGTLAPPTAAGECSTLPSGCGWRAAHFWHMNNSHEMMLVSDNVTTCTGDKAGDGEAIVFDNNGNAAGLTSMQTVLASGPATVTIPGPFIEEGPGVAADFYTTHWVQVADGKGVGQTRKITTYLAGPGIDVMIAVDPPWDVVPEPGNSKVTVLRQDWQIYVVDNVVDIRGCEKDNPNEPSAGVIYFHGNTADSTIESNELYESDGIRLGALYSAEHPGFTSRGKFQYFNEIRGNLVDGEYNFNDCTPSVCVDDCCGFDNCCDECYVQGETCAVTDCCSEERCCAPNFSWSGIELLFGSDPDSPSPVIGHGNVVAHNVVVQADALRGGAITVDRGWYPPPTPYQYINTLIHHNQIRDLERRDAQGECLPYNPFRRDGGIGIHIQESYTWNTVMYANTIEDVCFDVVDFGTSSVAVPSASPGTSAGLWLDRPGAEQLRLGWDVATCEAQDYAIYSGTLGQWTSLEIESCTDVDADLTETLPAVAGDRFFLVVPLGYDREGSYGVDSSGNERAPATAACFGTQDLGCVGP